MDASGRRRKLARRASLAVVAVLAGYTGLLAVSFAGGPIPPNALLPVPGVPSGRPQAPESSAPAKAAAAAPSSGGNVAAGGRPTAGATDHRSGARATTPGGAPGQSAPSEPAPTTPRTTSSAPPPVPTPTGTSAATSTASSRGNPTPPGRTRHQSPSASQSS